MKRTGSKTTQGRTTGCTRTEGAAVWMAGANSTGLNNKLGREADETKNISLGVTFLFYDCRDCFTCEGVLDMP